MLKIFISLIKIYQKTLSPDHGLLKHLFPAGICRFRPTCSQYMVQSITHYGWRGIGKGLHQLSQCHPYGRI